MAPQTQHEPKVSVVIPVYNDSGRLTRCLEALDRQTYRRDRYEVIVVDNGSEDAAAVEALAGRFGAIFSWESTPGSYAARNRGISVATGEVIAFTDADCIPAADWIERGVSCLQRHPDCGLVAGNIELFFQNPDRLTPVELFEKVTAFTQRQFVEGDRYGATANLFVRRSIFDRVGNFRVGLKSSGDREWGQRVHSFGYPLVYASDVRVSHPARSTFGELYARTRRIAGGFYDLHVRDRPSSWERDRAFAGAMLTHLIPPLMFVWNALGDRQLKDARDKLQVCRAMFFFRYVSALEILRLRLGRRSARA
ncbi:glycosyltransferase family 2 protein [Oscillatoriales cyanobacterium LEGE 11467]|uniref:Glycosyltransferase family 2 protein n=1 Tax=Zarconia navalis LEGE 11467 TaxID=1828826 RepID=A0A928VY63_9CYAN|nr:glycosyltransferase family A protein [Zarconia navalis]MBE9041448.1 glycosyltransferase family 2 protein [Zarconia navalis LEGE 11467]